MFFIFKKNNAEIFLESTLNDNDYQLSEDKMKYIDYNQVYQRHFDKLCHYQLIYHVEQDTLNIEQAKAELKKLKQLLLQHHFTIYSYHLSIVCQNQEFFIEYIEK